MICTITKLVINTTNRTKVLCLTDHLTQRGREIGLGFNEVGQFSLLVVQKFYLGFLVFCLCPVLSSPLEVYTCTDGIFAIKWPISPLVFVFVPSHLIFCIGFSVYLWPVHIHARQSTCLLHACSYLVHRACLVVLFICLLLGTSWVT